MNYGVKISPEIGEALEKMALRKGFYWTDGRKIAKLMYFLFDVKELRFGNDFTPIGNVTGKKYKLTSVDHIMTMLESLNDTPVIDGHRVVITPTNIKVGCQTVDRETVIQIYNTMMGLK